MKLFATLIFALLLPGSPAFGAIAHDATATGTGTGVSSLGFDLTVGGGCANPIIATWISWQKTPLGTLDTLTIGGSAGTIVDTRTFGGATYSLEMWRRVGVSTGANAVVATFDASKNSITMRVSSYCAVDQATPLGTPAKATSGSGNPTVNVTSASGELVIDGVSSAPDSGTQSLTVDGSQTQRANFAEGAGNHVQGGSEEAGASSVTMSWTNGVAGGWGIIGASLKPAASDEAFVAPINLP